MIFRLLDEPPVAGAVIWALEEANGFADNEMREKVLNSFRGMRERNDKP